jgi:3-oxoacyl-[acyl-carrier-protein] synthase-3
MTAGSRILAMGHYQPSRVITNDDLASTLDTNDAWIRDRVGIAERRVADGESVADMATFAAEKAIAASGFSYALATGDHAIRAGASRNALVIGAEKLSDITDWSDRTTAVLFGDGAGAAVLSAVPDGEQAGVGPVVWGSTPEKGDALKIAGWQPYIKQEGQAVFRWATTALAPFAIEVCKRAGIEPSELAAFVPHQANTRIIDGIVKRLGLSPDAIVAKDLVESGNTSAASVPLALSKLIERGKLPSGAPVLLFGFGGGLTYAGQVVRCP